MNTKFLSEHSSLIRRRLDETMAWCSRCPRTPHQSQALRTPDLAPVGGLEGPTERDREIVEELCNKRAKILLDSVEDVDPFKANQGRILIYYPKVSLSDGAAELASSGFFNAANEPPWDTWFYFGVSSLPGLEHRNDFLLSWIPDDFISLADLGVDNNPEMCLEWAILSSHPVTEVLKSL